VLIVDRLCTQGADQRRLIAAPATPQLEPSPCAEGQQRLTNRSGCSRHKHALAALYVGGTVKKLHDHEKPRGPFFFDPDQPCR
jgi:hypothetical protein